MASMQVVITLLIVTSVSSCIIVIVTSIICSMCIITIIISSSSIITDPEGARPAHLGGLLRALRRADRRRLAGAGRRSLYT